MRVIEHVVSTEYYTFEELELDCKRTLSPVTIAYETYGDLNSAKDNAILVQHALSGDAHATFTNERGEKGWWYDFIGPGKAINTEEYFVICSNFIGGCGGSTGPSSLDPETGRPYGLRFPVITTGDMVRAQKCLIDHLGIERLLNVIGGSIGGMQALQWVVDYPENVTSAIIIASTNRLSAQSIAFNVVGRQAIMSDPYWLGGDYYDVAVPSNGLSLARMIGHITYLSEEKMHEKFGRELKGAPIYKYGFSEEFQVESYLHYKGNHFVGRFDANSYLYITKAMDYFDISDFSSVQSKMLVISFSSDWLFPPAQSKAIVRALRRKGVDVSYCEVQSLHGHDAFLLEVPPLTELISSFLNNVFNGS
ncbi:MAG TPA: homoserine O-acetyltransferase [Candidatus Acidoferrales bacterium]|nr:homoserine O-acetyltransferase [Candidatus Acidoferrales bacterium]